MTRILIKKAKNNTTYDVDVLKQRKQNILDIKKLEYIKLQYYNNRISYRDFIGLCYKYNLQSLL